MSLNIKLGTDYLTLDYEGFRQMMIDKLKTKLPEYTDFSETDMGIVLVELLSHGLDIVSYYKDRQVLECFLETARERKNVMTHSKMFGYSMSSATPSKFIQVFELKDNASDFIISKNERFVVKTKSEPSQPSVYFEVLGAYDSVNDLYTDFVIPAGKLGTEKDINDEYIYQAHIIQGITIPKEVVGVSTGTSLQKFYTSYTPAMDYVPDSQKEFVVAVYVGEEEEEWSRVDSFLLSASTSKHFLYTVNEYGEGVVEFGNGISGSIPTPGSKVYVSYRIGGGSNTNVGSNTIVEMDSKKSRILSTFNPSSAYTLGFDIETIEEAKIKAPASLRTLERAVIDRDYADIGLLIDFIQSAESHYVEAEDAVSGIFLAEDIGREKVWLMPKNPTTTDKVVVDITADNMEYIVNYYDERRMAGQKVDIYPASICYIFPSLRCSRDPNYTALTVSNEVKSKLYEILTLGGYGLTEGVVWSDIVKALLDIDTGVTGLRSVVFVDGEEYNGKWYIKEDLPPIMGSVYTIDLIDDITISID